MKADEREIEKLKKEEKEKLKVSGNHKYFTRELLIGVE